MAALTPEHFTQVRRPHVEARSLKADCYFAAEWFQREIEAIFRPGWLFVARESALATPGDYVTRDLLGVPLIVLRDTFGHVRAYINSCRHRGSLLLDGEGHRERITCPIHGWTYDLDGTLHAAPGTGGLPSFHRADEGLRPVACETAGGFIFVRLSASGPSLAEYIGDMVDRVFKPYQTDKMKCVHERRYRLHSNWKTYVEVDMETLHTDFVHPASIGTQPVEAPATSENWVTVVHKSAYSPALAPGERHHGFPPMSHLSEAERRRTYFSILLPGFFVITAPDCMWWINKIPVSPTETEVHVAYCFPPEHVGRSDFDEKAPHYVQRWDQVIGEDDRITEMQQRGIVASVPGRYCSTEAVVHRLDNWILDRVLKP